MVKFCMVIVLFASVFTLKSHAAELTVRLHSPEGKPIKDAVVELYHQDYVISATNKSSSGAVFQVAQKDRQFTPFVSAVPLGSQVSFPNFDKTRHHVYSFSPAKVFELKLFSGQTPAPIAFEQPGVVALGCNIHDFMLAYIYIAKSRLTGVTNAQGIVQFSDLPEDEFSVRLWHPLQEAQQAAKAVSVSVEPMEVSYTMAVYLDELATDEANFNGQPY